ncbi:MAG TPA: aminotransferase class V-fold PLP-dependent enzyme [Solirubrobacterales bacterium]|nr:aminotransferase class V-fold PLP-dependent enzyme [Solirubrobacterales bacterium]
MSVAATRTGLAPAREFPSLSELCYLNTASIGLMPVAARFTAEQFERQLSLYGTTWFDERTEVAALDWARAAAGALLNVSPEQIAVTTSVTEALSQIAWSLRPAAGTNIVSIDLEFPSVVYPWMRVARETGAEVRLVRAAERPQSLSLETLAEFVDEDTEVICVSHVQYATGHRFDLDGLAKLAEGHGAWLIVDGSQSAGAVPIDLSDNRVDAFLCAGYKWLCGPFGAAICQVSPRLVERLDPHFVGWKSTADPYSMDASQMGLAASPLAQMEFSTMAYGAGVALAAAIEHVDEIGVEAIFAHNLELSAALRRGLEELGAEIVTPAEDELRSSILTAGFPGLDGEQVAAWLNGSDVIVSPRFGSTRFSPHFFNTSDDVTLALGVLERVLERREPVRSHRSSR